MRSILVEAAWIAITKDPSLRVVYDRISHRRGGKRAIVGVARRLVGRMRSCLKSGKLYEINIEKKDHTKNDINITNEKFIVQEKVVLQDTICATS